MSRTRAHYRDQLLALQPPGKALPVLPDSAWGRLLESMAQELSTLDLRSHDLRAESDPRATFELLPDWERVAGLPDPCLAYIDRTVQDRRGALHATLTSVGGQSIEYYIGRAADLGHEITIVETRVSIAGVMQAGDELAASPSDRYSWRVDVPVKNTYAFVAGASVAGDELGYWQPIRLECLFDSIKPAHTSIEWRYIN